jgi:tRNA nucleotidyltransferase (CCA-adding enzyme)
MALAPDGQLIDPCGGQKDLKQQLLRHTPAFRQDPIRVLRLARLAARYHPLGFRIAEETIQLVEEMIASGELDDLVPERLFAEIAKALQDDHPAEFFRLLQQTGTLARIMPELDRLFGVPQPEKYHPEIDSGIHSLLTLEQACFLSKKPEVRFAALLHDLGKGTTPKEEWPRHIGHEERGVKLVKALAARLQIPNEWRDLAMLTSRYHMHCHRALEMRPGTVLKCLKALDALRRPERFEQFLAACKADGRGSPGDEKRPYPEADFLRAARDAAAAVDGAKLSSELADGDKIAERIWQARVAAIKVIKQTWEKDHLPH